MYCVQEWLPVLSVVSVGSGEMSIEEPAFWCGLRVREARGETGGLACLLHAFLGAAGLLLWAFSVWR